MKRSENKTLPATFAPADPQKLDALSDQHPLEIAVLRKSPATRSAHGNEAPPALQIRLYQHDRPIALSDILPVLENMGLRTLSEATFSTFHNKKCVAISDLSVTCTGACALATKESEELFGEVIELVQSGRMENDGLNRLALAAGLSAREITLLRAMTKYLQQTGFQFSRSPIEKALAAHPEITQHLVRLFCIRHGKKPGKAADSAIEEIENALNNALDAVTSLNEDRILRQFWQLIRASLRTNYFQTLPDGSHKPVLSIKYQSGAVPDLPLPHPLYEIFVYSPIVEGIHLRATKVARGGIRWSERREDFRTEILGLMKAQRVKNAVIVPSGAKGGFVLKRQPLPTDRAALQQEAVGCYKMFIRGLLDLTDNLQNNKVVPPQNVICHDDPDIYLVVAADRGTATFSDIANSISAEYDFWLGDAFASGGSAGYDHKKIGITARGAWESIKRHFRELEIDVTKTCITVAGIGDMSGDVFGNGMMYSSCIRLVAAFDHRDIFIDPDPDTTKSLQERKRLFALPNSSWQDYDRKLLSAGGGVWSRSAKSITLSAEAKKCLGTEADRLTPAELVRVILQAPVDLLFNGGIGTYVKASTESNADVSDRNNDFCRINGNELRAKVVGEGGNLGFTQQGRIEYALGGGLINTDFIDNSGGVDCSDHEVNIKILLNQQVSSGKMTLAQRNRLLVDMTQSVASHVLQDNYRQALAMSFSAHHALHYTGLYQACLKELEASAGLNRKVEYLPDDKKLLERKAEGKGLTRPELAVILAYSKIWIKDEILRSSLTDDPWFSAVAEKAFPEKLASKFQAEIKKHRLYREIIATQLSNDLVNFMGISFVYRLQSETSMPVAEIVRAFVVAASVFHASTLQQELNALDFHLPVKTQFELMHHTRQLLNLATRWFLRGKRLAGNLGDIVSHYQTAADRLESSVLHLMSGATRKYEETIVKQFAEAGLPEAPARKIATVRALYTALNIIEVATENKTDLDETAHVYFETGTHFGLVWFRDQIAGDSREGHWNNMARLALRDTLDNLQRRLTLIILQQTRNSKKSRQTKAHVTHWLSANESIESRWKKMLAEVHGNTSPDYTLFFVALQELAEMMRAAG